MSLATAAQDNHKVDAETRERALDDDEPIRLGACRHCVVKRGANRCDESRQQPRLTRATELKRNASWPRWRRGVPFDVVRVPAASGVLGERTCLLVEQARAINRESLGLSVGRLSYEDRRRLDDARRLALPLDA